MQIERALTPEEQAEMIKPNSVDYTRVFKFILEQHEAKCTEKKIPFCRRCAYLAFERVIRMKEVELGEMGVTILGTNPELIKAAKEFSFEEFTGKKYFDIRSVAKVVEPILINLNKVPMHTANFVHLQCKKYKHPQSLKIPLDDWKEWETENFNKTEKKEIPIPQSKNPSVNTVN